MAGLLLARYYYALASGETTSARCHRLVCQQLICSLVLGAISGSLVEDRGQFLDTRAMRVTEYASWHTLTGVSRHRGQVRSVPA